MTGGGNGMRQVTFPFPDQPTLYAVTLGRETSWRQVEQELGAGQ